MVRARRGMSLLESILSFFLLLMVLVFLINLYPSSFTVVRRTGEQEQADSIAQTILADQSAQAFSTLVPGTSTHLAPVTSGPATYQPRLDIFAIPGQNARFIMGLRVTVTWTDKNLPRSAVHELWVYNLVGQ